MLCMVYSNKSFHSFTFLSNVAIHYEALNVFTVAFARAKSNALEPSLRTFAVYAS